MLLFLHHSSTIVMPIVKKIQGDLFDAEEKWVLQQCNCVTVRSHGLSTAIDHKWGVNPYSCRRAMGRRNCAISRDIDDPGTNKVMDGDDGKKKIICAFAQWAPGKPGHYDAFYPPPPSDKQDTTAQRLTWFEECLENLDLGDDEKVAVPYKVGCGLAGGDWKQYKRALDNSDVDFVNSRDARIL